MNKHERSVGAYLTLAGGIIAVIALILYGKVMYKFQGVYYMLIAAIVLSVLCVVLAGISPAAANLIPVVNGALMGSAAVWGASLMVNQIGYVYAGLDGFNTIVGCVTFAAVALTGMIIFIVAAFLPAAKPEPDEGQAAQ